MPPEPPSHVPAYKKGQRVDDYLENRSKDWEWGGNNELEVPAYPVGRRIEVTTPNKEVIPTFGPQNTELDPILLGYNGKSHYCSLEPGKS